MMWGEIFDDSTAVSSVIGIILMVAIAVILAAVVATFALGFGDNTEVAPQGAFSSDQSEKHVVATGGNEADFWSLTIAYEGGEAIAEERLDVLVNGEKAWGAENVSGSPTSGHEAISLWNNSGSVEAGDTVTVVHKDTAAISEGGGYDILPDGGDNPDNSTLWANSEATSGSTLQLNEGDTVQVIWESRSGETTAMVFEETID